jgi:hypothetical protein
VGTGIKVNDARSTTFTLVTAPLSPSQLPKSSRSRYNIAAFWILGKETANSFTFFPCQQRLRLPCIRLSFEDGH